MVWNATEQAVSRVVPKAIVSFNVRVAQRSVSRDVQLTRTSVP